MTIHVQTLPELRVFAAGNENGDLQRRRQQLALLVYLAVERASTRDTVLAMFWPERDDGRARHAFNQNVYELRSFFNQEWIVSRGDKLVVQPWVTTDLANFEAAVRENRFADALALYGGNFLEGMHLVSTPGFENWLDLRRAQTARLYRRACREVLAARLRARDLNEALAVATRWTEVDPMDDEAQQHVIELLGQLGRRTEAIRQFEQFEERLRRDELEPMPDLVNLMATMRAGLPTPAESETVAAVNAVPPQKSAAPRFPPDLELLRLLGEGQVARVYLAREVPLGRLVAVKVLSPHSLLESVQVRRFEREARTAARIQHPNVIPVFRVGALVDGARYIVLQYVEGGSLEDRLAAVGPLASADARRFIGQIAAGLAATHRLGIVHRDLRPGNVLYDRHADRVLITDFGTAHLLESDSADDQRLTLPGQKLGLPAYSSPEQLQGEPVTERSDVYSLGVVAFELLTGSLPFAASTAALLAIEHLHSPPPAMRTLRPDVDPVIERLVERCLQKRPEQRPYAAEIASLLGTP
jgi:DNA-binding SARP family transcriptional activator/tRNA A-37 threonylcarbamoyl transferase component Bud32